MLNRGWPQSLLGSHLCISQSFSYVITLNIRCVGEAMGGVALTVPDSSVGAAVLWLFAVRMTVNPETDAANFCRYSIHRYWAFLSFSCNIQNILPVCDVIVNRRCSSHQLPHNPAMFWAITWIGIRMFWKTVSERFPLKTWKWGHCFKSSTTSLSRCPNMHCIASAIEAEPITRGIHQSDLTRSTSIRRQWKSWSHSLSNRSPCGKSINKERAA